MTLEQMPVTWLLPLSLFPFQLPSSLISESVSLLSEVKHSASSWLARIAARCTHQPPQQHGEVAVVTKSLSTRAQAVQSSFLCDLCLDRLSSGDWERVSLALGSQLHPVLTGSVLAVSAQSVLRYANSKRAFTALLSITAPCPRVYGLASSSHPVVPLFLFAFDTVQVSVEHKQKQRKMGWLRETMCGWGACRECNVGH